MSTSLNRRGKWVSCLCILLVLFYVGAIIATAVSSTGFPPEDLYATIIATVTLISTPLIVLLWVIIHELTPTSHKVWSLTSLAMIIIFAILTCINRYIQITVVRPSLASGQTDGLSWFLPYGNPSVMASLEQLAWGFFFGLALLALTPVYRQHKPIFWTLLLSGILSLGAILGQVLNLVFLTFVGVIAWGPGFLVVLLLFFFWFNNNAERS